MEGRKIALVTGAGRGIGRQIALALAKKGAFVIVNYNGSKERAMETVEEIKKAGGDAVCMKADVSNADEVKEMIDEVLQTYKRVDILVNNAGITKDGLLMKMSEEDFDKVIDVNLKSAFLTTKCLARQMLKQREGAIVNVSSIVGLQGNAGQANYAASKAGIIGFTKSCAREFASRGIRVNAVAPGFIETDMTDVLSEEVKNKMLEQIPLNRVGSGKEVADVVAFLTSEEASYITGQVISVDGGITI